jgi:putative DNA primase/helicase
MNGKSCFLNLLKKFVGIDNITSTELDTLLTSRFEITKLHKKLVCTMGETDFSEMTKTSIIKRLTGGDLIGFEYKNKTPFDDNNYAKILIATNNLPATNDKSIGFYRRWLIVDFKNKLKKKGFEIKDFEVYKTCEIKKFTKALISFNKNNKFEEILIFSQNSLEIFNRMTKKHNLVEYFNYSNIICLSKKIAKNAQKIGFKKTQIFHKNPVLNKFYDTR